MKTRKMTQAAELKMQAERFASVTNALLNLERYLRSDKFRGLCNDHVNINDVLLRLAEMQAADWDIIERFVSEHGEPSWVAVSKSAYSAAL